MEVGTNERPERSSIPQRPEAVDTETDGKTHAVNDDLSPSHPQTEEDLAQRRTDQEGSTEKQPSSEPEAKPKAIGGSEDIVSSGILDDMDEDKMASELGPEIAYNISHNYKPVSLLPR